MENTNQQQYNPRTVEEVFNDFKSRRAGMIKALTDDVEDFCKQCDPEKENLCLYGYPDESWEVNYPAEEVPPELPEPALGCCCWQRYSIRNGINFARDGMERKAWLSLVAVHSDSWLLSVAFFYGAHFDKAERKRLFNMMNTLPTIYDTVTGKKQQDKTNGNSSSRRAATKPKKAPPSSGSEDEDEESPYDEYDDEHGETRCGTCDVSYQEDKEKFWIGCDICRKWFHGSCVKVTPARAEHIKHYKCPQCNHKRARN